MWENNFLARVLKLVLKPDQRQLGQLLQRTMLGNRFFQRLPLGDGGATGQAVSLKTSPGNIRHGSRQGLHSTGTHLVSKAHGFRQTDIEGEGEPASQDTAAPASPSKQTTSTNRYAFTFNSFKSQLPHCRTTKALSPKLETDYPGSLDPGGCQGMPNRFCGGPRPNLPTKANGSKYSESSPNRGRSTKISLQGGYPLSITCPCSAGVSKHPISCTEKRGGAAPCGKFETSKSDDSLRTFQDGGNPYVEGPVKKGGLSRQNRPERRIPDCTHLAQTPKVSPLSLGRQYVGVCMPPLRPCKCTQGIHQATQASSICFKANGVENYNLSRRHPDYVPISRPSIDTCGNSTESFRGPRVCSKLRKVLFGTIPSNRVYRNLQAAKNQALRRLHSYETIVHLDYQAVQEIQWWRDHLVTWNGRAILR